MASSVFDPQKQVSDTTSKIVLGLERLGAAYRTLLWEHSKVKGLSPIQIQFLLFIAFHNESLCNVSYLAKYFNLTKPTVSDALKVLREKKLIQKVPSEVDKRAYNVQLTPSGKSMVVETEHFANPIHKVVQEQLSSKEQSQFFHAVFKIITGLNKTGVINLQNMCSNCRFYQKDKAGHYCQLLEMSLTPNQLRIDCPEFEPKK